MRRQPSEGRRRAGRPTPGPGSGPRCRRAALALLALPFFAAALGACGFEPLYGRGGGPLAEGGPEGEAPVRADLAAIRIDGLGGRVGQILRNDLIDELNPAGIEVPPEYVLLVRLRRESRALAVQLDDTATRRDFTLAAAFQLRRLADGRPVYTSLVRRVASYDIRRQPFATLIAEQDAERRAARAVSEDIATQLAVVFTRGLPDEGDVPEAAELLEPEGAFPEEESPEQ